MDPRAWALFYDDVLQKLSDPAFKADFDFGLFVAWGGQDVSDVVMCKYVTFLCVLSPSSHTLPHVYGAIDKKGPRSVGPLGGIAATSIPID